MKKLLLVRILILGLFGLMSLLQGCGGTETGNPSAQETPEDDIPEVETQPEDEASPDVTDPASVDPILEPEAEKTATRQILDALCAKLVECFPDLSNVSCVAGIALVENIDQELGLEEGEFKNYLEIFLAEFAGEIVEDQTAAAQCVTDTQTLSCDEPSVRAAYDPSDPNNFDPVEDMIPESCQKVFVSE